METNSITLTPAAIAAIERLQHINGTHQFYTNTLTRLFNFILDQSDEIGMSDTEAIHTLRVLQYLKADLDQISGMPGTTLADTPAAEKVEATFAGVSLTEIESQFQTPKEPADQLDAHREMLANDLTTKSE